MGKVTALGQDVITEKSGHTMAPMAVSVCTTPAAPSPIPVPYPVVSSSVEGVVDAPMRTKINGALIATVGSCTKSCHGNEAGTLKEVVSLNTTGPNALLLGAPTVICEMGMMGITGSLVLANKAPTAGAGTSATGAGGTGGPGGGSGGPGAGPGGGPGGPGSPGGGGGSGGGGSNQGASAGGSSGPKPGECKTEGHPVDVVTGDVVDGAVDLSIPGLIPLIWGRVYSSARRQDTGAAFGPGWRHEFEQWIVEDDRLTVLHDGDGRRIWLEKVKPGEETFHRRERLRLRRPEDGSYRVFSLDSRLTRVFAPAAGGGGAARLRAIEDAYGNAIRLEYDGDRLTGAIEPAGRRLALKWQGRRIVRAEIRVEGHQLQWVDYVYSTSGCLISAIDALGQADQYEYDQHNRMSAATLKTGVRFQYAYEKGTGRCRRTWGPNGLYAVELRADAKARTVRVEGEEPRIYTWNDQGLVVREALPDGTVLRERAYDDDGFLIAEANGAGEGTQYWHDEHGNTVRAVDAMGNATTWAYEDDLPVQKVAPDGQTTSYGYNEQGSLLRIKLPSRLRYRLEHDERGRMTALYSRNHKLRAYEYDARHLLAADADARGARSTYTYDLMGRPTSRTDALGRTRRVTYDVLGRPATVRLADGTSTRTTYDALGNVAEHIDALGGRTLLEHGGTGVLKRISDPDGQVWRFRYTSKERLKEVRNPRGDSYCFAFDEAGRVVEETTFDGRTIGYSYSQAGRLSRIEYPDGTWRAFTSDRVGLVITDECKGSMIRYQRDPIGRLVGAVLEEGGETIATTFERDRLGRVVSEMQGDRRLRYAYDSRGRRTRRVMPDGTATNYLYDEMDALIAVAHGDHGLLFERDVLGREVVRRDATGAVSIRSDYDALDRLVDQRVTAATPGGGIAEALVQRRWQYDKVGRVTRIEDARWGTTAYKYDLAGKLLEARRGEEREVFDYDPAGALRGMLRGLRARAGEEDAWEIRSGGFVGKTGAAKYAYDQRGRRIGKMEVSRSERGGAPACDEITEYTWDDRDQLREVKRADGTRVRFTYDGFGRRVRKEVDTGATVGRQRVVNFVWDGDALAADVDRERGTRTFVHFPGTQIPLLQAEKGEVFIYVNDHLGMPKELIDRAGKVAWSATHSAWGKVVETYADAAAERNRGRKVESPFRLLGQYADEETGLGAARFRYFDPDVGRWLSPDALGLEGGRDVLGWNGSPTFVIDPLGLDKSVKLNDPGYCVYGLYNEGEATPYYVGITNDFHRREDEHIASERLPPGTRMEMIQGSESIKYAEARGREQAYIEHYGTKPPDRKGTPPGNVINSFRHERANHDRDKRGKAFEAEYLKMKRELDAQKRCCTSAK